MENEKVALSKTDLDRPPREIAYYGGVRQGFEKAREGLDEVVKHCEELLKSEPNNIRLERYCAALRKITEKVHRLQMKSSRIRDRIKKKEPANAPNFFDVGK